MKRTALFLLLLASISTSAFAQDSWRDRRYVRVRDNTFELTPFVGYRYGGTIRADQTFLYGQDVDVRSSANYGVNFAIPLGLEGLKLELMLNRQDTEVGAGGGLFTPSGRVGDFKITNYQAGLIIPFSESRTAIPYAVVSAGVANLDPSEPGIAAANRFSASGGIGVKVPINRNLGLRIEARGYYTSLGNDDQCTRCYYDDYNHDLYQGETSVGLSFKF